jgi:hypothetical protein
VSKALRLFQEAGLQDDPEALQLVSELANVALRRQASPPAEKPAARASHVILPSGGGLPPAADTLASLRAEYERRVGTLRPGDVAGLLELKREFRRKGLEVY